MFHVRPLNTSPHKKRHLGHCLLRHVTARHVTGHTCQDGKATFGLGRLRAEYTEWSFKYMYVQGVVDTHLIPSSSRSWRSLLLWQHCCEYTELHEATVEGDRYRIRTKNYNSSPQLRVAVAGLPGSLLHTPSHGLSTSLRGANCHTGCDQLKGEEVFCVNSLQFGSADQQASRTSHTAYLNTN